MKKIRICKFVSQLFHFVYLPVLNVQNSCWLMFFKKGVLKNFPIFTEKHLCWSFFLIKLQVFLKTDRNTGVFLLILRNLKDERCLWVKQFSKVWKEQNLFRIKLLDNGLCLLIQFGWYLRLPNTASHRKTMESNFGDIFFPLTFGFA